jgi:hypothetical protein
VDVFLAAADALKGRRHAGPPARPGPRLARHAPSEPSSSRPPKALKLGSQTDHDAKKHPGEFSQGLDVVLSSPINRVRVAPQVDGRDAGTTGFHGSKLLGPPPPPRRASRRADQGAQRARSRRRRTRRASFELVTFAQPRRSRRARTTSSPSLTRLRCLVSRYRDGILGSGGGTTGRSGSRYPRGLGSPSSTHSTPPFMTAMELHT